MMSMFAFSFFLGNSPLHWFACTHVLTVLPLGLFAHLSALEPKRQRMRRGSMDDHAPPLGPSRLRPRNELASCRLASSKTSPRTAQPTRRFVDTMVRSRLARSHSPASLSSHRKRPGVPDTTRSQRLALEIDNYRSEQPRPARLQKLLSRLLSWEVALSPLAWSHTGGAPG